MPNRIPTPGIKTPTVRKSPMVQPAAKPAGQSQVNKSENMFKGSKSSGNVAKDKAKIANKTGVWPNGYTN